MLSPREAPTVKVLLLDPLPSISHAQFTKYHIEECFTELTEGQLCRKISEFNLVLLSGHRNQVYLTDEVLKSAHRLLAIGVFGRLANGVDVETAQTMGIPVFTSPFQHQHSTAEFIISNIVLLSRQIGDRSREIHLGNWNKVSSNCHEVRNKTLGIVGYGHVGSQLGIMAEALSLKVVFYDSMSLMPIGRATPMDSMNQLLSESDFVSINVSCIPENRKMFNKTVLESMKPGSYLINCSYGDAVDVGALADVVKSGHLRGASLDVFPQDQDISCLYNIPNVILSNNIASETAECFERIVNEVIHSIVSYMNEGTTIGAVNYPSVAGWPLKPGSRRIVNMHRNVRGVLKEIDYVLSAYNVGKQVLDTKDNVGYLIADINTENVTSEIVSQLAILANSIRTRVI